MFDNVKIGKKLIGGFVAIALLAAVVGVVGVREITLVNDGGSALYLSNTVPLAQAGELGVTFNRLRFQLLKFAVAHDPAMRADASQRISSFTTKIDSILPEYEKGISSDEERAQYTQFRASYREYSSYKDELERLASQGASNQVLLEKVQAGQRIADNCNSALDQILALNEKQAKATSENNSAVTGRATWMMVVIIVITVAAAIGVGLVLTRGITQPLAKGMEALRELSLGHLGTRLRLSRKDEVGELGANLDQFADDLSNIVGVLKKVAAGDLSSTVQVKDAQDEISPAINRTVESLRMLISEMDHMSKEHNAGEIDAKVSEDKFDGSYKTVARGVNGMVAEHIQVKKKAMACIAEFGKGNFEAALERFPGKKAFINETIEQVRANLKALITDADLLVKAAVAGQLSTRADASRHHGDFRKIVEGVNTTLDAVIGPMQDVSAAMGKLAGGDLTVTIDKKYPGDFEVLANALNTLSNQVRSAMQQIGRNVAALAASAEELNRVSQTMGASADQTATQANVVSAATDQVSKNVQTVATGADEMGASIKEIAKNTAEATRVATNAVRTAEATNETISKLGQSSAEIGQVIKVITSIAQQTNLLALNATIEAARAGEAGKGFAVVANEVKELAKETAKATEDISRKIEAIQADTSGSVSAINQISQIIGQISDIQNTIASAIEEQSATTNEIGRNLAEAAKGSTDISKNVSGVAEAAQATTVGATDTLKSAQGLEKMAAELQTLVAQFRC